MQIFKNEPESGILQLCVCVVEYLKIIMPNFNVTHYHNSVLIFLNIKYLFHEMNVLSLKYTYNTNNIDNY